MFKIPFEVMHPTLMADLIRAFEADLDFDPVDEVQAARDGLLAELTKLAGEEARNWTMIAPSVNLELAIGALRSIEDSSDYDSAVLTGLLLHHLDPRFVGALIRQQLPADGESMTRDQKLFWLAVDENIGPDYAPLKTVGDFVSRFNNFK